MSARRAYGTAMVVLLVGSGILLLAYAMTWADAEVPILAGAEGSVQMREFTGGELYPGAAMSGWVGLAAVAGILATRSWGRVAVAVLTALAGLAGVAGATAFALMPSAAVDAAVSSLLGVDVDVPSSPTQAWILAVIGGLAVAIAGGWTAIRGRGWPSLGRRYERRPKEERAVSDWEAQDLGQDPTDDLVE